MVLSLEICAKCTPKLSEVTDSVQRVRCLKCLLGAQQSCFLETPGLFITLFGLCMKEGRSERGWGKGRCWRKGRLSFPTQEPSLELGSQFWVGITKMEEKDCFFGLF